MSFLSSIFFFVLGAIIGSFINVLVLRYGTGFSILGRSHCFSCNRQLRFYELVPVVSFFALSGRCRTCRSRIAFHYPLVELTTAILFFLAAFRVYTGSVESLLHTLFVSGLFSILMAIAFYDVRHKIIPDGLVYAFILASLCVALARFVLYESHSGFYANLLAGPFLFIPFFLLWFFSSGRLMGLGDGKLTLGIGWLLGLSLGASAIIIGVWVGAFVGLILVLVSRLNRTDITLTMKSEIPFAPFLIAGTIIVFFSGLNLFSTSLF